MASEENLIQRLQSPYGTYMPALIEVINKSNGPVLELGTGMFSTPYLHYSCTANKRKLVSYENNRGLYEWAVQFKNDFHDVHFVDDWDKVDLGGHFSVALIDHEPPARRKEDIKRLANSADYIVVHDTNPRLDRKYKYSEIYPLFKHRRDFNSEKPYSTILSNLVNLSWLNLQFTAEKLNENSLVIDAGGYQGNFTGNLGSNCHVIIFEPEPHFYEHCKERFKNNLKIKIERYALGKKDGTGKLYIRKDGTSLYKEWAKSAEMVIVSIIKLSNYIKDFSQVDLLKLNIEGSEYEVIQDLAENEQITKIKEILVQFHRIDKSKEKYHMSQEILSRTHRKTEGKFKWETWERT